MIHGRPWCLRLTAPPRPRACPAAQQGIRSLKQYSVELEGAVQVSRNEVAGLRRGAEAAGREVVSLRAAKALSEGGLRQQVGRESRLSHAAHLLLASRDQLCSLVLGRCSVAPLSFGTKRPCIQLDEAPGSMDLWVLSGGDLLASDTRAVNGMGQVLRPGGCTVTAHMHLSNEGRVHPRWCFSPLPPPPPCAHQTRQPKPFVGVHRCARVEQPSA